MAGTITKNLKLKAVLDDQQFRKQLAELRKELGGINMGGGPGGADAGGFDRSAKMFSEAVQALKQVAESFKKSGFGPGGSGSGSSTNKKQMEAQIITDAVTKNASNKVKRLFDSERARYINLKPGHTYDQEMGKTFQKDMEHEKSKSIFREKAQKKEQDNSQREAEKQARLEARRKADERKKDINSAKDTVAALLSKTGMGLPMGRQVAQSMSGMAPGMMESAGGFIRGAGPGLGMAAGITALAGLVVHGIMNNTSRTREYRIGAARENQEIGTSTLEGKGLEGIMLHRARNDVGAVEGSLAAGLGAFNVLNPFSKNFATDPREAGYAAIREREEQAQQATMAETELGRAALGKAKSLRQARNNAMRGGAANSDQLTYLQGEGATRGFSQEETLQQFTTAKQFLGNDAANYLPIMQSRMNMTGMSVEDQATAAENLMGAKKGTTAGQAMSQSLEILKKGVAAGLDVSKSGQFLKLTADYVRSNQGLGQIDSDAVAEKLADAAAGFAGGGAITATNLQQAAQLQEMRSKESTSETGFSGLGNIQALQDTYGNNMDTGQLMAGMNISANATPEDVMKIMGGTKEQAEKFLKAKNDAQASGLSMAGIDPNSPLGIALASKERGITSEQQLGAMSAKGFVANKPTDETQAALDAAGEGGVDRDSLVLDFKTQQDAFNKGVGLMAIEANNAGALLKIFREQLEKSTGKTLESLGVRNKSGK